MKTKLSQLERDTAAYFENMSEEEAREERELEAALAASALGIDIDEPNGA
jgi:hypothetical protein